VFWLFALWLSAGQATTWPQRLMVAAVGAVACVGYFNTSLRQTVVTVGLLLLTLVPRLPGTTLTNRLLGVLAGSSLYIYLTHWQVYPLLADRSGPVALIAALATGVLFGKVVECVAGRQVWRRRRAVPVPPVAAEAGPPGGFRSVRDGAGAGRRYGTAHHRPPGAAIAARPALASQLRFNKFQVRRSAARPRR
jgi:hypothetical protein